VGSYVLDGFSHANSFAVVSKGRYHLGLTSLLLLAGAGSVHDATALMNPHSLVSPHPFRRRSHRTFSVTGATTKRAEAAQSLSPRLAQPGPDTMDRRSVRHPLGSLPRRRWQEADPDHLLVPLPATNAMLRRRSSGWPASASTCSATHGFYIPDVPLEQIRFAGFACSAAASGSIRHRDRPSSISIPAAFGTGRE